MTSKQLSAVAALLVFVALAVGWSSWRLLGLTDQMAVERSHLHQRRTGLPVAGLHRASYHKTAAIEASVETDPSAIAPAAPALPNSGEARPAVGHVLEVRAPVDGRIESIGSCVSEIDDSTDVIRGLKPGDHIAKGHVLATIWSADVGEKKHRFLTAASKLLFDEAALETLRTRGSSKNELADALRHRDVDRARLERAHDVLSSLMMSDEQIEALRHEAGKVQGGRPDYSTAEKWEELEIHAPHDGIVASIHVVAGHDIEGGSVLFQIVEVAAPPHEVDGDQLADSIEP